MTDETRILILAIHNDLHAYAIRHELHARGVDCSLIELDRFPLSGGLVSWSTPGSLEPPVLREASGRAVDVRDFNAAWWRRLGRELSFPEGSCPTEADRSLVTNDTRAAVLGLMATEFQGTWVSDPEATRRAENKLVQLRMAHNMGLSVPRTIVTQDPLVAQSFCQSLNYEVIIKPVRGSQMAPVLTGKATPELVEQASRVLLSPTIFQEYVPGIEHLRVNCFGDICHSYVLETDQIDWRMPLTARAKAIVIDPKLSQALVRLVRVLGLRAGMMDLKVTPDGRPIFLEVNPQGQFLFLDGLCGTNLLGEFASFLQCEAVSAARKGAT